MRYAVYRKATVEIYFLFHPRKVSWTAQFLALLGLPKTLKLQIEAIHKYGYALDSYDIERLHKFLDKINVGTAHCVAGLIPQPLSRESCLYSNRDICAKPFDIGYREKPTSCTVGLDFDQDLGAFSEGEYFLGLSTEHTSPRYVWRLRDA